MPKIKTISATEIKRIRTTLGLTQQELADELQLTRDAIAQWEGGRCSPQGPARILLRRMADRADSKSKPRR